MGGVLKFKGNFEAGVRHGPGYEYVGESVVIKGIWVRGEMQREAYVV